jgi:GNAT superfamily N-acetyltransferase
LNPITVAPVPAWGLREPLRLLERWLRHGEPVPDDFAAKMRGSVEAGDVEVLAARLDGRMVGVLVLAFRPSVSLGAHFASIEDLYVISGSRRRGVGGELLKAADERCRRRGVYYVEAQVKESVAEALYAALGYEREAGVRVFSRSLVIGDRCDENHEI